MAAAASVTHRDQGRALKQLNLRNRPRHAGHSLTLSARAGVRRYTEQDLARDSPWASTPRRCHRSVAPPASRRPDRPASPASQVACRGIGHCRPGHHRRVQPGRSGERRRRPQPDRAPGHGARRRPVPHRRVRLGRRPGCAHRAGNHPAHRGRRPGRLRGDQCAPTGRRRGGRGRATGRLHRQPAGAGRHPPGVLRRPQPRPGCLGPAGLRQHHGGRAAARPGRRAQPGRLPRLGRGARHHQHHGGGPGLGDRPRCAEPAAGDQRHRRRPGGPADRPARAAPFGRGRSHAERARPGLHLQHGDRGERPTHPVRERGQRR